MSSSYPEPDSHLGARWHQVGHGSRIPLISVHTWNSDVDHDRALAAVLEDRPIIGLLIPDEDRDPFSDRVQGWVAHHLATIDELDVDDPLVLMGWSFGGLIAVELARALRRQGRDVRYVGLIDSKWPKFRPLSLGEAATLYRKDLAALPTTRQRARHIIRGLARSLGPHHELPLRDLVRMVLPGGIPERPSYLGTPESMGRRNHAIHLAFINYRGTPVDFPLELFVTSWSIKEFHDEALDWRPLCQAGLSVHPIAGDHFSIYDDANIATLRDALIASVASRESGITNPESRLLSDRE